MKYIICNCLGNIDGVNCRILKFELGELGHINTCSTSVALSNLIKDIIGRNNFDRISNLTLSSSA